MTPEKAEFETKLASHLLALVHSDIKTQFREVPAIGQLIESAIAQARKEERLRCERIVEAEEELGGPMPLELLNEERLRSVVRTTKRSILKAIREGADLAKDENQKLKAKLAAAEEMAKAILGNRMYTLFDGSGCWCKNVHDHRNKYCADFRNAIAKWEEAQK